MKHSAVEKFTFRQGKAKRNTMTRDSYERKAYGFHRMSVAVDRLNKATSREERINASRWIELWSTVSRVRQFKLGNGGGSPKKRRCNG